MPLGAITFHTPSAPHAYDLAARGCVFRCGFCTLAEGRILTRDWSKYNGRADVVFQPRQMSPEALLQGFQYAEARFYSCRSVLRRLSRSPVQLVWTLPLNLAYAVALRYRR